jgi:hypothetical protein
VILFYAADSTERPAGRRQRQRRRENDADKTSFSEQEYEAIRPGLESEDIKRAFSEDHLFKYGTPDPSLPASDVACGGCGAYLHSRQIIFIIIIFLNDEISNRNITVIPIVKTTPSSMFD